MRQTADNEVASWQWIFVCWRMLLAGAVFLSLSTAPVKARDVGDVELLRDLGGYRYGISVTDLDGEVLVSHRADERFAPASNAKLFVTAASLASEEALAALDYGLRVIAEPAASGPPTLVLLGRGDPTTRFGENCTANCIEALAAAAANAGLTHVGDIVGDDRWFADERRPLGWSWDDLKFGHATSISAIAVNDNIIPLRISPADVLGARTRASWADAGPSFFDLKNESKTSEAAASRALRLERRIGDRTARLYGELPAGSRSVTLDLGVDDPAHLAAWYFKNALEAEGVSVSGELRTRRRPLQYADEPIPADPNNPEAQARCASRAPSTMDKTAIASLRPTPIRTIVNEVNRDSQNLYAEVLLRQLGRAAGTGSSFCGLLQIQRFLDEVGVPRASYDFADGSGLSNYNRVTPATITTLLRYAAAASWGEAYRASLPVGGGAQGTLKYRFRGTALEGKIFAKTGTLNHVDALSGYMTARSGRTLVFSVIINDRPLESASAMGQIESTLLKIAAHY